MKKLFTIAFLSISFLATKAQSGSVLVGGDVNFNSTKNENQFGEQKTSSYALAPYIGYQFNDHWTAGAKLSLAHSKTEQTAQNDFSGNQFTAGPFIRYTKRISDLIWVYGQLEGGFGKNKSKTGGITTSETNITNINLYPAVFLNIKDNFGLNLSFGGLGYARAKFGNSKSTSFGLNFGSTANIGISKNFGGKK